MFYNVSLMVFRNSPSMNYSPCIGGSMKSPLAGSSLDVSEICCYVTSPVTLYLNDALNLETNPENKGYSRAELRHSP